MDTERIINSIAAIVPRSNNPTIIGKDGLKHCAICEKRIETEVEFLGIKKIVPCICECQQKEFAKQQEERKEAERRNHIERLRVSGFPDKDFKNWTFENDDGSKQQIMNVCKKYVENFKTFKKSGKGLLLYGNVGTGKTYAAACIANALIDNGTAVLMTNFSRIINQLQEKFDGKQKYLDGLNEYDLVILDDLAAERQTEYMQENIYNVIDNSYRANKPLIITTNLTIDELANPSNRANARIYDRILERCFPVEVSGASHRRQKINAEYNDVKNLLGL